MRTNFILLILICFILVVISCSQKTEKSAITVYTSLYPLEMFTKWIMPDAQTKVLIPSHADPHHFEPSLKDIQELYNANMVIYLGDTDIDRWIEKIKNELNQKGIRVLKLQDHISFKKYLSSDETDPHVWLDPLITLDIIKVIKEQAIKINPSKKDLYEKNFSLYSNRLKELDSAYKQALSNCSIRDIITTHEFLNYLSERYGFRSHFIVHEPEQEPSLKKIKKLKDFMKKNSIEYIVSEPEGEKFAKTLSEETEAKILKFNTFHHASQEDYFQAMSQNLQLLKTVLKCS